jgi:hypothetical protein
VAKYPKHEAAVEWAAKEVGTTEHPLGSNHGTRVDYYQSFDFLAGSGYPWCISFDLAAWAEGAERPLPYRTAGAYTLAWWARRVGWAKPLGALIPGDLVIFNVGSGHGALLELYKPPYVHTIDGNSLNRVRRVRRHESLVHTGIAVPEKPLTVPVPEPFWVIVTSEGGHRQLLFTKFATEAFVLNKVLPRLVKKYGKAGITIKRGGVRKKKR